MHDSSNNYIYKKVVLSPQSLPLHADTCAMEQKLGMARKIMQKDRILSFLPSTLCEKQLNPKHAYTSYLKFCNLIGVTNILALSTPGQQD